MIDWIPNSDKSDGPFYGVDRTPEPYRFSTAYKPRVPPWFSRLRMWLAVRIWPSSEPWE